MPGLDQPRLTRVAELNTQPRSRVSGRIAYTRLHCAETMELLYGPRPLWMRSTKDSNLR
jgi:hypothetical protein